MERMREASQVYDRYHRLYRLAVEKGRRTIPQADPRIGPEMPWLLAHNWGNDAAKQALRENDKLTAYVSKRQDREYRLAEHRDHIRQGEVGQYLWCPSCQR